MPKCRKCGAEIRFVQTKSGKYMPVDPDRKPYREGGSTVYITTDGQLIHGAEPFGPEPVDGYGYTPHWATCPNAEDFKR